MDNNHAQRTGGKEREIKKTLADWLPTGHYQDDELDFYLDMEVVGEFFPETPHVFNHKNIRRWCIIKKPNQAWYYALGWNENLQRGWSFPVKRIKKAVALDFINGKYTEK